MKERKPNLWSQLQDFTYAHKRITWGLTIGMILVGAGAVTAGWFLQPKPTPTTTTPSATNKAQAAGTAKYYSPLTGMPVADAATTKREVTAIMIENSIFARPQSGIKDAGVVFEAIAEGGITRIATLHQEDRPGLIGPVRSLRPYYLDWIAPFDASIAHVGGSNNALLTVRNGTFKDIDQFFNGNYYWRATDRAAPHNVYTNFDKLDALNQSKGYTSSSFTGWPRKIETPATTTASHIDIPVSSADYNVAYDYEAGSNSYVRFLGGAPSVDREGGQVKPKVVIVLKIPMTLGFEDGYREQMTTTGTGEAYIFQDGTVTDGIWRKDGQRNQLLFYDKNARTINLDPGQTWVTVVTPDKAVAWR